MSDIPEALKKIQTASAFWDDVVVPDFSEYINSHSPDLRKAMHAASALFHMSDWVFVTHKTYVEATFTFVDRNQATKAASSASEFANSLEQATSDFGLIRGIANASKHLDLKDIRPVHGAPSNFSNLAIYTLSSLKSHSESKYQGASVQIEAAGQNIEFSPVAENVFKMWRNLKQQHNW
jgi:hypothetical protein